MSTTAEARRKPVAIGLPKLRQSHHRSITVSLRPVHRGLDEAPWPVRGPATAHERAGVAVAAKVDRRRDRGDAVHRSACHALGATPQSSLEAGPQGVSNGRFSTLWVPKSHPEQPRA